MFYECNLTFFISRRRGAIIELVNESLTRQQTPMALTELCNDKNGEQEKRSTFVDVNWYIFACKFQDRRSPEEKRRYL